jgi:hypothetical protein
MYSAWTQMIIDILTTNDALAHDDVDIMTSEDAPVQIEIDIMTSEDAPVQIEIDIMTFTSGESLTQMNIDIMTFEDFKKCKQNCCSSNFILLCKSFSSCLVILVFSSFKNGCDSELFAGFSFFYYYLF